MKIVGERASRRGPCRASWRLLVILLAAALPPSGYHAVVPAKRAVTFGVVVDGLLDPDSDEIGPSVHFRTLEMIRREVETLAGEDFDIRFPPGKTVEARWSLPAIRQGLERLLADPEVDMVLAQGVFATHVACKLRNIPKPLIAPFGVEPQVQDLPRAGEGSGVPNLSYLTIPTNFVRDMEVFRDLLGFDKVHVMHDAMTPEVIEHMYDRVIAMGRQVGFEAVPVPVISSPEEALAALPSDTQAVYFVPLLRMSQGGFQKMIDGLRERRIPSFTIMGREDVERGVLATSSPATNLDRIARRVALNVHRILLGEEPSRLPVEIEASRRLAINMKTAEAIGWYPDWRVILEADLIDYETVSAGRVLLLREAVRESVEANLSLAAAGLSVNAARENIRLARSALLPQADLRAGALQIDEDRAAASLGMQPEMQTGGGLGLTQIVWSDRAHANLSIQKDIQDSRERDLDALRLDTALGASVLYLELLRADALSRIEQSNLDLTESNLQLARRRQEVGVTGPAEVYRWESAIATDKARVLKAWSTRQSVRVHLNAILHRPLEEEITPVPPTSETGGLYGITDRLYSWIRNERSFRILREFVVSEGIDRSPEVASLDAAIEAQERELEASRRSFWSPDLLLSADIDERFSQSGAGADRPDLPSPPFPTGFLPGFDETTWSVGVSLGIPLFTSGRRTAEVARASTTLDALRVERSATAEKVEERLRVAVFATAGTWPNIELSAEAAQASRKNLDLVTEMYGGGVVSIVDLLDAQNASRVAEQVAANAIFDFLIDLMEIERAASNFEFFVSDRNLDDWVMRLESFAASWSEGAQSREGAPR